MEPANLRYTAEHEWVRIDGETVEVGITHYAQQALGDIVYVSLPQVGTDLTAGSSCGEVESTKSVSDIYAPLDGVVTERNSSLDAAPEAVNGDPYGSGWLFRMSMTDATQFEGLLSAAEYRALTSAS
jgi:glycine cleavage system H protein